MVKEAIVMRESGDDAHGIIIRVAVCGEGRAKLYRFGEWAGIGDEAIAYAAFFKPSYAPVREGIFYYVKNGYFLL